MLARLPSIPGVSVEKFFMMSRAEEAAQIAAAMGIAYEEDRQRAIIMRAKAKSRSTDCTKHMQREILIATLKRKYQYGYSKFFVGI